MMGLAAVAMIGPAGRSVGATAQDVESAQDAEDGTVRLAAASVFGADHDPGEPVTVAVTVEADRLVVGEVTVQNAGDRTVALRQPVEVAGSSTKRLVFVVPTPTFGESAIEVQLTEDGDVIASTEFRLVHDVTTTVVGVLPQVLASVRDLPAKVVLGPDLGDAVLRELDPDVLALGRHAVEQLDTVIATSADVAGLSPAQRATLFAWVDGGGRLLLDDATQLDVVPAEWRPGPAGYSMAGAGEIRIVDGDATAGRWTAIIEPVRLAVVDSPFGAADSGYDPTVALARRSGVTLPELGPILAGLAAYVVFVGPVLFLILRRIGRLTAAWTVIPLAAVMVAAVVGVIGGSWRRTGQPAASVFVESNPVGSTVSTLTLVFSRSGGEVGVDLPEGWAPSGRRFFSGDDGSRRTQTVAGAGSRLAATLEPGQVVLLSATGGGADRGLVVEALVTGRTEVTGTVTNSTGHDLASVTVFGPDAAVVIGPMAAGASEVFELRDVRPAPTPGRSLVFEVWSDPDSGFAPPFSSTATPGVDLGLWSEMSSRSPGGLYAPALVRVVGWSDARPSEIAGDAVTRTGFSSVGPIRPGAGPLSELAVRSELVSPQFDGVGNELDVVYRFVVPPETTAGPLELDDLPALGDVEALVDGEWVELEEDGSVLEVPWDHVRRGVLLVRGTVDFNQFGFDPTVMPTLSGASA